jgi:2-amino-4-hydroxy-6-hydroxymethyldihydropteridine diphosphokinase
MCSPWEEARPTGTEPVLARLGRVGVIDARSRSWPQSPPELKRRRRRRRKSDKNKEMSRETVYIGFGSNQGDRFDYCDRAVTLLSLLPNSQVTAVSSLYETEPVADARTNPGAEWFLNGVVSLETDLTPRSLLEVCREVEQALGRDHDKRNGPRTLDLDILFYGSRVINEDDLIVPHPRLHLRRFVLTPMVELDPTWRHPVLEETMEDLLDHVDDRAQVRRVELPRGSRYGARPACSERLPPA